MVCSQQNQKKGGRQGALCSAGHPNLQGHLIQFQHLLQLEIQLQIHVHGSRYWNFRYNWDRLFEIKSLVVQSHFCRFSVTLQELLFRSWRFFDRPGKFSKWKSNSCTKGACHVNMPKKLPFYDRPQALWKIVCDFAQWNYQIRVKSTTRYWKLTRRRLIPPSKKTDNCPLGQVLRWWIVRPLPTASTAMTTIRADSAWSKDRRLFNCPYIIFS